jgi:hypothetical protein
MGPIARMGQQAGRLFNGERRGAAGRQAESSPYNPEQHPPLCPLRGRGRISREDTTEICRRRQRRLRRRQVLGASQRLVPLSAPSDSAFDRLRMTNRVETTAGGAAGLPREYSVWRLV